MMRRSILWAVVVPFVVGSLVPAGASAQNDAGSGGDAGNTFAAATPITPAGRYQGTLDASAGDAHDYYRFHVAEGGTVSVLIETSGSTDPIEMLAPDGTLVDVGVKAGNVGVSFASAMTTQPLSGSAFPYRVAVYRALVSGEYRLHLQAARFNLRAYDLCFMNCDEVRSEGTELIFGGSLPTPDTQVLLVPPSHGDLGNPLGPTVVDYIDATLRGIRRWETAMAEFADDYPQFSYLDDITVDIEVFDGVTPIDPAGYDVIIGYVAAGPVFRGVASDTDPDFIEGLLREFGLGEEVHYTGRVIALSLFGAAPRAGQVLWDFPEVNDLEIVTIHEFGHTFGLGHTRTWHPALGPDIMNSPFPLFYGDGSPVGDGGDHTPLMCLSSLNLYGMAVLYEWMPSGQWRWTGDWADLPPSIPYELYC